MSSILNPDTAYIWVPCPGSVLLSAQCENLEDKVKADAGTAVHAGIMTAIYQESRIPTLVEGVIDVTNVKEKYTQEEKECIDLMVDHVRDIAERDGIVNIHCEETTNIPQIHLKAFGTPDVWGHSTDKYILHIWDYKHGHGIVEAFENWQCLMYVSSMLNDACFELEYKIKIHIIQPRAFHRDGPIRTWSLSVDEFKKYEETLIKAANAATGPNPPTIPGKHCRYCRGRRACRALESYCMAAVDYEADAMADHLTPTELGLELAMLEDAANAIKYRITGLTEQAEHHINRGQGVPGWQLEGGSGNLAWAVPLNEVFGTIDKHGFRVRKDAAITPTQAKKLGVPADIVDKLSHRPKKKPKLKRITQADVRRIFPKGFD